MSNLNQAEQLSKPRAIAFHLYPGIIIVLSFTVLAPFFVQHRYPAQLGLLASIILVAVPLLLGHLKWVVKKEHSRTMKQLNRFDKRLSTGRLILYASLLVVFAFLVWGLTQPVNKIIAEKFLSWLPGWFTTQDFSGYSRHIILVTLILNLVINGFVAPFVEEYYFRGYLLPRMAAWGKWAFVANAILFSLYHFWQPYVYLTLIISLLPMTWLVWKTRDLRLAIVTHCLLNIIGALLSFGLILKS